VLPEKLRVNIGITDNNEVINEFYNLIELSGLKMPEGCLESENWSFKTVMLVVEKLHQVKILLYSLCGADKNSQF
jgi:hypothetical protein